ncbi:MAG: hypothetical protein JWO97_2825 [Acidobacteria bacterium]|nr:hypothetical protein [Acidobacteriota bacterium]
MTASLQGSLHSFKLPDVLSFLATTRKSGTLTLTRGTHTSYVFFDAGAVVYAGSNQEDLRLSAILLRKKRISRSQFEAIDALMAKEGGRFGQLAIQQRILSEDQLRDYLKVQVSEIIYDCFVWPDGAFTFVDELALPPYAVTIAVDLSNLIMEGARRIEEWEQCLQLLPDSSIVFRVVSNPDKDEKITLSRDEWKILFLINGQRTLEELCHTAEDEPFQVYRVVYGLLANKLIEETPHDISISSDDIMTSIVKPPSREDAADDSPFESTPPPADETIRQGTPTFGADSTMREQADDTQLLVSKEAKLTYRDLVKPTVAQLTFANGELRGTVVPLIESEYLVGRRSENNIAINDLGVSGFHARIFRGPDGYVVEDLKSRNGTWVNGGVVYHALLKDGDALRFGATEFKYELLATGS